ncbi:hypothetical protein F5B20DRAFT_546437 [Whalleya microplaca]|nr:hypothetical protein F5B20DRAFT_546437 [Whalleya microplaca]
MDVVTTVEDRQRTRNRLAQRRHRERKKLIRAHSDRSYQTHVEHPQLLPPSAGVQLTPPHAPWDRDDLHMLGHYEHDPAEFYEFSETDTGTGVGKLSSEKHPDASDANMSGATSMVPLLVDDMLASLGQGDWRIPEIHKNHEPWATVHQRAPSTSVVTVQDVSERPESSSAPTSASEVENANNINTSMHNSSSTRSKFPQPSDHRTVEEIDGPVRQQEHLSPNEISNIASTQCSPTACSERYHTNQVDQSEIGIESLESQFERVLSVVEEAGFDSIDSMTSTYYTAKFSELSIIRPMQLASRNRRLRTLLSNLQQAHKSWSVRESCAYREEITRGAEDIYSAELRELSKPQIQKQDRRRASVASKASHESIDAPSSIEAKRCEIAQRIREVLSHQDIAKFIQKDAAILQDTASETWSLMTELTRIAGMQPHERTQLACLILYLLTSPPSTP